MSAPITHVGTSGSFFSPVSQATEEKEETPSAIFPSSEWISLATSPSFLKDETSNFYKQRLDRFSKFFNKTQSEKILFKINRAIQVANESPSIRGIVWLTLCQHLPPLLQKAVKKEMFSILENQCPVMDERRVTAIFRSEDKAICFGDSNEALMAGVQKIFLMVKKDLEEMSFTNVGAQEI